jgi:small nuclear ribonucleoprotein (snRNP)-like protein
MIKNVSTNLENLDKKEKKTPSPTEFLNQAYGRKVIVKLTNNNEYRGILICIDGTMNVVLEQCEEISNGQIINRYSDVFIRGNNGKHNKLILVFYINSSTQTSKIK